VKLKHVIYRALQPQHANRAVARLRELEKRLQTPTTRLAIPFVFQGKGFFKGIQPMQSQVEIAELYSRVIAMQPRAVVEIGTCHGGTLYLWCQAAHPEATLVSIDLPGGEFGGGYRECRAPFYHQFKQPGQTLHLLRMNSHSADTAAKVRRLLDGTPVDFLFIDGDHTYAGVKQDFELYSAMVRSRGLIALHDIAPRSSQPEIEVWRFWQELKSKQPVREALDHTPNGRTIGIGMVDWRAAPA
jgi:predicted O-methyltransferase YrrM